MLSGNTQLTTKKTGSESDISCEIETVSLKVYRIYYPVTWPFSELKVSTTKIVKGRTHQNSGEQRLIFIGLPLRMSHRLKEPMLFGATTTLVQWREIT